MLFFGKKKKEAKLKILLDFRSSSIGGAVLVEPNDQIDNEVSIIYTAREYIYPDDNDDPKKILKKLNDSFDNILKKISEEGIIRNNAYPTPNRISEVVCMFSSPWYKTKIKNFEIKEQKPIKFTESFLKRILNKEKSLNLKKDLETELEIEKKIVSVYLNGYEAQKPFGKVFEDAKVSFYIGIISKKVFDFINSKIEEKLNPRKITLHTHPFVIVSFIRNFFRSSNDFLFFDFGGETTDIGMYKNSIFQNIITVPIGLNFFIKNFCKAHSVEKKDFFSEIDLIYDKRIDENNNLTKIATLEKIKSDYILEIQKIIGSKWQNETTPSKIFVTADMQAVPVLDSVLKSKNFYANVLKISTQPIVHYVSKENFPTIIKTTQDTKKDSLLEILANFSTFSDN
ncbi:MAG TPA: hypothetical protein PKA60_00105 [Candidatus Paceibacterota bacterium]|nr:hypothetical protein [Candidatus Paceibacterota bacterium]